jgi:hypothetical protein
MALVVGLIVFGVVGAIALTGVLLSRLHDQPKGRRWMDGLGATIITSIILLGVDAGLSRRCMPKLDWSILLGQIELTIIFGVPIILFLIFPAFATAGLLGPKPRRLGVSLVAAYIVVFAAVPAVAWRDARAALDLAAILCTAATIGFLYARFPWMRRLGVPIGIAVGIIAGVVIFASLPFGADNCYP